MRGTVRVARTVLPACWQQVSCLRGQECPRHTNLRCQLAQDCSCFGGWIPGFGNGPSYDDV
jgi:hypothetical protein